MSIGMKIGANIVYLADIDPMKRLNTIVTRMNAMTRLLLLISLSARIIPPWKAIMRSSWLYLRYSMN